MNRTRTSKNAKRLLVWLLLLTMVFSLLPMAAFADETVVEPVVSEEPVQETEPSEPTEAPSEPTQEPETISELEQPGNADVTIESDEEQPEEDTLAAEDEIAVQTTLNALLAVDAPAYNFDASNPLRVFHLDCGRKYFDKDQIKAIIELIAKNHYTHLELVIGNEGMRFLLNDNYTITTPTSQTTYTGAAINSGIKQGNKNYSHAGELSESDMEEIFDCAKDNNISIIPLLNSPGHMNAIITCMEQLGISNVKYYDSARTIDLNNTEAVEFTQELVKKYAAYFKEMGCTFFNIGTDEYANDKFVNYDTWVNGTRYGMGFGHLQQNGGYANFVTYVNNIARIVKGAGLIPMAFNDGFYYNYDEKSGTFDKDIIVCFWNAPYSNSLTVSADYISRLGYKILNTNGDWYYVLGRGTGTYSWASSSANVKTIKYDKVIGTNSQLNPVGCMLCVWCDTPGAAYNDTEVSRITQLVTDLAKNNKDVFKASDNTGDNTGDNGDVIEIRVPVGETKTEVVSETEDVRGSFKDDDLDESTALVSPDYINTPGGTTRKLGSVVAVANSSSSTGLISDGTNYMVIDSDGNISSTTDINDATEFTVTRSWNYSSYVYTIQGNGNYLTYSSYSGLSTSTSSYDSFSFSYNSTGFCYSSGYGYYRTTYYLTYSASGWKMDESLTTYGKLYSFTTENKDDVSKTVLTITGVAVGTTYCEINGKTYKIIVEDKAPDGAMTSNSLTLEYWITNYEVYDGQSTSTNHTQTITTSTAGATSDEGIEIATIAPSPAYSFFDGTKTVYYWQAMRLDADNKQTNTADDDETSDGTTLTHVRYHGGAWQYKTVDGVWHYFVSTDQLVAYYLQKQEVTKEVTTFTKDWGYKNGTYDNKVYQVALTVAVVYPDGTVSPTEDEMLNSSTLMYNFSADSRDIGIVAPVNNSDYTISKITVTNGARDDGSEAYNKAWEKITWEKKTTESGGEWYDETEVWNESEGTAPMVNGKAGDGIRWTAKNTAKLVLIYLEAVKKDTNLNVEYWDDNAGKLITSTQISMTYTGTNVPTYDTALKSSDGTVIGKKHDWSSNVKGNANYLPDDAYVTNSSNVNQTINKNLTEVRGVTGIYKSGIYEYIRAEISEDGKTLTLHYNLKNTGGKTYVVDFGLPIAIPFIDYDITNDVDEVSFAANDRTLTEKKGEYGYGEIDKTSRIVTYTLTETIDNKVAIPIFLFNGDNAIQRTVYVVPATSVYYEDNFADVHNGKGVASDATWELTPNKSDARQALTELGKAGDSVYGYDSAYASNTQYSMNGYSKVTVESAMASDTWDANNDAWPTATFTFKGTGFDVISLTNNQSGAILVSVYSGKTAEGKAIKKYIVDNYFGYEYTEEGWKVTNDAGTLYQIPVMKITGLDYGEYTAVITVFYDGLFDNDRNNSYSFWLDAIRVYDPMGENVSDYTKDKEGYPQYIKLRTEIINKNETNKDNATVLFIDGAKEATVEQYKNFGPNNEVYLASHQAISFKLPANKDIATVQIGAKSPDGKAEMNVNINGTKSNTEIGSATEMYYRISTSGAAEQQVTITNTGSDILSLTNLKITYTNKPESETALMALTDSDAEGAVATVRALFAAAEQPDEPEKTFDPKRFDCEWSKNVRKGGRAILTVKASTDVEYILINGVKYDKFVTRTERIGWGRNALRVTYREFVYMITADEVGTINYDVAAVNGEGVQSAARNVTLTVNASSPIRDWIGGLFGRWF